MHPAQLAQYEQNSTLAKLQSPLEVIIKRRDRKEAIITMQVMTMYVVQRRMYEC